MNQKTEKRKARRRNELPGRRRDRGGGLAVVLLVVGVEELLLGRNLTRSVDTTIMMIISRIMMPMQVHFLVFL